jgi:predicted nucleic acid-binding protein
MELIDTDVLIDVQRGFGAAADWFATDPDVGIPGFVVMELVQDARNSDEVQKALALVDGLEVVWPSDADERLKASGRPIAKLPKKTK